jgi:hypothetical protein
MHIILSYRIPKGQVKLIILGTPLGQVFRYLHILPPTLLQHYLKSRMVRSLSFGLTLRKQPYLNLPQLHQTIRIAIVTLYNIYDMTH